ncbi:hypothetical protein CIG75_02360 [Tumebacillus algifaecis]|uniref:Uncharacterized protein n=1 Tax=Tumebacillus algifaecis TaxID=1214604 RepID=A0A223CXM1_9BACL|nr:DUF6470 family protein [Tumebacillus algifaecis]ASS73934.1 hypothetical protein CIG75_02360 [Tumebacillus algifaecis]
MVRLEFYSIPARHEINIKRPQMDMHPDRAPLELDVKDAKLELLRAAQVKIDIDTSQMRADIGYKPVVQFVSDAADKGRQDWLSGVDRIVSEGNQISRYDQGTRVGHLADQRLQRDEVSINIKPVSAPVFNVEITPRQSEFTPGHVRVNYKQWSVNTEHEWGTVTGRMIQYPDLVFSLKGNLYDTQV